MSYNGVFLTAWDTDFGSPSLKVSTPEVSVSASSQGVVALNSSSINYMDGAGRGALITGLSVSESMFLASKHSE